MKKSPPSTVDPLFLQLFDWKPTRSQQRQIQILKAAIETLATLGIEGASLDAIGKRIGMDRSHLVYYFKTKENLIQRVIEYISSNAQRIVISAVQSQLIPKEQFKSYVIANFQWAAQFPTHVKVMALFYYLCGHKKHYASMNKKMRDVGVNRLASILREAGYGTKKQLELEHCALAINNLIVGTITYAISTGREEEMEALGKTVWEKCAAELEA